MNEVEKREGKRIDDYEARPHLRWCQCLTCRNERAEAYADGRRWPE